MKEPSLSEWSAADAIALASRETPVVFYDDGFRVRGGLRRSSFYRYDRITHVSRSRRGLAIATLDEVILLRRRELSSRDAEKALEIALRAHIARQPNGGLQLARMAEIEQLAHRPGRTPVVYAFVVLCLLAFWLQFRDPFVSQIGSFIPSLFEQGELWRLFTANFLHDLFFFPVHLGLNLLCVVALGVMVERVLGSLRAIVVIGASAIGAMLSCALASYAEVIGASGVAAGLAGALLCIELRGSQRLPAWWRIPRRLFIAALLTQAALDFMVPMIAGAAHVGGFVTGYLVTGLLLGDSLVRRPASRVAMGAAMALVLALLMSTWAASTLVRRDDDALESHALRLLHARDASITHDNDVAWLLVTEAQPTGIGLHVAAALAERAVERSGRSNPDLLDTLAEVLFASGDIYGALEVIDEAIDIAREEPYFREQRRRFTGERSADDRPPPPSRPGYRLDGGEEDAPDSPAFDADAPEILL